MKSGSAAEPGVKDVAVVVVDTEFTVTGEFVAFRISSVDPDGLENCRPAEPSAVLSCGRDRGRAAGEIDTDDGIVRICGCRIWQRQRGRIVDPNDRDVMLHVGLPSV